MFFIFQATREVQQKVNLAAFETGIKTLEVTKPPIEGTRSPIINKNDNFETTTTYLPNDKCKQETLDKNTGKTETVIRTKAEAEAFILKTYGDEAAKQFAAWLQQQMKSSGSLQQGDMIQNFVAQNTLQAGLEEDNRKAKDTDVEAVKKKVRQMDDQINHTA